MSTTDAVIARDSEQLTPRRARHVDVIFQSFNQDLPIEKHWDSYGIKSITNGHEEEIYKKDSLLMKSLGREPGLKEDIKELSNIETEKYDDIEKLIMLQNQWLK